MFVSGFTDSIGWCLAVNVLCSSSFSTASYPFKELSLTLSGLLFFSFSTI